MYFCNSIVVSLIVIHSIYARGVLKPCIHPLAPHWNFLERRQSCSSEAEWYYVSPKRYRFRYTQREAELLSLLSKRND